MNLVSANHNFWLWFWKIFWVFFKSAPFFSFFVILFSISAKFTRMLAFMLPLKVILLVGTPGIPRYFRFFIEPEDKMQWVMYLIVGAIACYLLTLILDFFIKVLSRKAGGGIFDQANEIALVSAQEDQAGGYYSRVCRIFANGLFVLLVLTLFYFVNTLLLYALLAGIFIQGVLSIILLLGSEEVNPNPIKKFILEKRRNYLESLLAFNFFGGFFVILYPYLVGEGGNILFAIISFLLLRQLLGSLTAVINSAVVISSEKHKINAFVFREFQLAHKEKKSTLALFDAFSKTRRTETLEEVFSLSAPSCQLRDVEWKDSTLPGVTQLVVKASNDDQSAFYLENVFTAKNKHHLDNEEYLFEQLPRKRLWAPELIARYPVNNFECQVVDYGSGLTLGSSFNRFQVKIFSHLWGLHLPDSLVLAYRASHKLLHERLTKEFFERVRIAVDSEEEEQIFSAFLEGLDAVNTVVESLPVVLINPDLNATNLVWKAGKGDQKELENILITSWARWKLEPLGVGFPLLDDKQCRQLLDTLAASLSQEQAVLPEKVKLVQQLANLESSVSKMKFKAALGQMTKILEMFEAMKHEKVEDVGVVDAQT